VKRDLGTRGQAALEQPGLKVGLEVGRHDQRLEPREAAPAQLLGDDLAADRFG
jgi:hypothetical protein